MSGAAVPRLDPATQCEVVGLVAARSDTPVPGVVGSALESEDAVVARTGGRRLVQDPPYTTTGWLIDADHRDRIALQDDTVWAVAGVHMVDLDGVDLTRFGFDPDGAAALRQHVGRWRAASPPDPTLDDAFDWLDAHWPAHDGGHVRLSWGDAQLGNVVYDSFRPAALISWGLAGIAPPGVDLGSIAYRHLHAQRTAESAGAVGLADFCSFDELCETYEARTAVSIGDRDFWLAYAAARHVVATGDAESAAFLARVVS